MPPKRSAVARILAAAAAWGAASRSLDGDEVFDALVGGAGEEAGVAELLDDM
jgi:hypothetical protein